MCAFGAVPRGLRPQELLGVEEVMLKSRFCIFRAPVFWTSAFLFDVFARNNIVIFICRCWGR